MTIQLWSSDDGKAVGDVVEAVVVDVTNGGVRLELHAPPAALVSQLGPNKLIKIDFTLPRTKLRNDVLATIAWCRPPAGDEPATTLGAYFHKIRDVDRATILRYAQAQVAVGGGQRPSRLWPMATAAVAAVALVGLATAGGMALRNSSLSSELSALRKRVVALEATQKKHAEQLTSLARTTRQTASRPNGFGGDAVEDEVDATALKPIAGPSGPAAANGTNRKPAAGSDAVTLSAKPVEVPEGIRMASVEFINGDFVGRIANTAKADSSVSIVLEYDCKKRSDACRCQTPSLVVPGDGTTDFACTPEDAPVPDLRDVTVRVKLAKREAPPRPVSAN